MIDVYITFDDGRSDNLDAFKIMKDSGIVGTLFVTCDFVENPSNYNCFGNNRVSLKKNDLQSIIAYGNEIASHGFHHQMSTSDFRKSVDYLKSNGLCNGLIGFSVPNSNFSTKELNRFIFENKDFLKYVRIGRNKQCYTISSKIQYCLYHIFGFQWCFDRFNSCNLIYSKELFHVNSTVIKKDTRLSSLIRFIDKYSSLDCSLVLMFHSIVEKPSDPWEWSTSDFEKLCIFLSKHSNINCKKMSSF